MSNGKLFLLLGLGIFAAVYVIGWVTLARNDRGVSTRKLSGESGRPSFVQLLLGFLTNVFDTLGIGSFATTTAVLKLRRMVPDELIPGTLNAGHTLPTVAQATIFVSIIAIDMRTLSMMIAAACVGAWLGAGVVARWPRIKIQ